MPPAAGGGEPNLPQPPHPSPGVSVDSGAQPSRECLGFAWLTSSSSSFRTTCFSRDDSLTLLLGNSGVRAGRYIMGVLFWVFIFAWLCCTGSMVNHSETKHQEQHAHVMAASSHATAPKQQRGAVGAGEAHRAERGSMLVCLMSWLKLGL